MFKHILLAAACLCAGADSGEQQPSEPTKLAWENLKAMAGEWQGSAHDGRKIRHRVQLIAAGSVVMNESWFEGHPGEMMVTMYAMDGDKLRLIHYCVAKNQPRLEATKISPDGKKVLFTFLDGGNIPTRDKGHMDKAAYTFLSKDKYTSRWTWYASGKEQWMEEFTLERVKAGAKQALGSSSPGACCLAKTSGR